MKQVILAIIRGYQRFISPALPPSCRFYPTCSHYGYEAIETHGIVTGSLLAGWRILRCNPFSRGGYDPVPPVGMAFKPIEIDVDPETVPAEDIR